MIIPTGAKSRFDAIRDINSRTPRRFDPPRDEQGRRLRISEFFGMNTFDLYQMRDKLPKEVYTKLRSTIEMGRKLDPEIANTVAHAIKEWALAKGVTHFCHWFQPQTGLTAEKHDSFFCLDEQNRPIEKFSGFQLIQGEPDASSFPSGGMRTTFEARGYTAWDPSSPVFIMETASCKTLCVPSVFISHNGDTLDEKTGLLKSVEILSQKVCELLQTIGITGVRNIVPTLGIEQEYFLIDRAFYSLRPDLVMTGRTLIGGQPPKGQQLEDHYFGSIAARVQSFMSEMEYELYKLGVPIKTRHNEVAPSQFECAPIFEEADIAVDHNQLVMEVLRKVAIRHNFSVLMHEKPFSGVNGSGKHCNWSLAVRANGHDLDNHNLLEPGMTADQNLRFLLLISCILKGVYKHSGLLRAGVASAGNDHRLGANEAPPAIMSVFLGDFLSKIFDEIENGSGFENNPQAAVLRLGVDRLPEVMRDNADRNRTSPFAFTGNKFEFRAVGSSASVAFPVTLLNAAVTDGISEVLFLLKTKMASGLNQDAAILATLREVAVETKAIRFEGNNYSEDWIKEAEKRGLPNHKKTPSALTELIVPTSEKVLTELGIFSKREVFSRHHVKIERYIKNITIEVDTLRNIVDTLVLPACYAYHSGLSKAVSAAKAAGVTAPQLETLNKITNLLLELQQARGLLDSSFNKSEKTKSEDDKAKVLAQEVLAAMAEVRSSCDELESIISDDIWPLPKYREILFLS